MLSAVQLICLGLLGEYVARIYQTVQNRPTFHVGFDSAAQPAPIEIPQQRPAAAAR